MIARVAESCWWMFRYTERIQATSRLLEVNLGFVVEVELPINEYWKPLIVVMGEEDRFLDQHGEDALEDGSAVQEYLVWDRDNPSSIFNSLVMARENARQVREVISEEMWSSLNEFWHWMRGGGARRAFRNNPHRFYATLRDFAPEFYGVTHDSILHEEPFDFMRLGLLLERAGQTARTLDVKYHMVGPTDDAAPTAIEHASWLALLRSCSAFEPFFKRHNQLPIGPDVAGFLIFEQNFPRSIRHCVDRSLNFIDRIRSDSATYGEEATARLAALRTMLDNGSIDSFIESGLHERLTEVVERVAGISDGVSDDFFSPQLPETRVVLHKHEAEDPE